MNDSLVLMHVYRLLQSQAKLRNPFKLQLLKVPQAVIRSSDVQVLVRTFGMREMVDTVSTSHVPHAIIEGRPASPLVRL